MKFTTIIATVVSMAAFAIAAPVANEGMLSFRQAPLLAFMVNTKTAVAVRQNHGMCVKGTTAGVEQIEGC